MSGIVHAKLSNEIGKQTINNTFEHTLDNGFKIIVREDQRAPVLTTQVWYKVGSSYEPNGISGISHVLEHMMFRGTKQYPQGEFSRLIAIGGGHQNAFTSQDFTAYYQEIDPDRLELCLKLEADRMINLDLKTEAFKHEMKVVMEERRWRTDDKPESLTLERLFAAAHISNPYHQPIVGWMNDLENLTVNDVQKWYDTWYGPDNAVLVIVGDVKAKDVFKLAETYFGKLKPIHPPTPKPRIESVPLGTRSVVVKQNIKVPTLFMAYNVPSLKNSADPTDPYALLVLLLALDGGDSSRFSRELIRNQAIASRISSGYNPFHLHDTLWLVSANPSEPEKLNELKTAITQQFTDLKTNLLENHELERIKINAIASNVFTKDSMSDQALEIGMLEAVDIPWQEAQKFPERIGAVTAEQVRSVAQQYLTLERLTIAKLLPSTSGN